jgi:hypothetical protein
MKTILFIIIGAIALSRPCGRATQSPPAWANPVSVEASKKDSIQFALQIQPILTKRCSPCHFTGGKMYAALPFDRAETILGHKPGVMKRIKETSEIALFEQFYAEHQ